MTFQIPVYKPTGGELLVMGDWLAAWGDRMPDHAYAEIAAESGWSARTLMNAKSVCLRFPKHERHPDLKFSNAAEIVGRSDQSRWGVWALATVAFGLSAKDLRQIAF